MKKKKKHDSFLTRARREEENHDEVTLCSNRDETAVPEAYRDYLSSTMNGTDLDQGGHVRLNELRL